MLEADALARSVAALLGVVLGAGGVAAAPGVKGATGELWPGSGGVA